MSWDKARNDQVSAYTAQSSVITGQQGEISFSLPVFNFHLE